MRKIASVSVPEYRVLRVRFDDGFEGTVAIDDAFTGVAESLNNARFFATAKIIDDGYAVGFENCEYDICSTWLYQKIANAGSVDETGNLKCAEDRSDYTP